MIDKNHADFHHSEYQTTKQQDGLYSKLTNLYIGLGILSIVLVLDTFILATLGLAYYKKKMDTAEERKRLVHAMTAYIVKQFFCYIAIGVFYFFLGSTYSS